jgi:hypothetical protein
VFSMRYELKLWFIFVMEIHSVLCEVQTDDEETVESCSVTIMHDKL